MLLVLKGSQKNTLSNGLSAIRLSRVIFPALIFWGFPVNIYVKDIDRYLRHNGMFLQSDEQFLKL